MFDTTKSYNMSTEYRPSSRTYYKTPSPRSLRQPISPNLWAYKSMWCQPWSIILFGIAFVVGISYVAEGSTIATIIAAVPILFWWYVSLALVPSDFRKYVDNQKNKTKKKPRY